MFVVAATVCFHIIDKRCIVALVARDSMRATHARPTSSTGRSCIPGIAAFDDGATATGICAGAAPAFPAGHAAAGDAARADGWAGRAAVARSGPLAPAEMAELLWRDLGRAAILERLRQALRPRVTGEFRLRTEVVHRQAALDALCLGALGT
jgi:hypothetical protein